MAGRGNMSLTASAKIKTDNRIRETVVMIKIKDFFSLLI
jgi:hypothetical protein